MKKITAIFAFLLTLSTTSSFAQTEKKTLDNIGNASNQAEFTFEKDEYAFGTITQGQTVSYDFTFTNTGNEPLIITNAQASCGCTVPQWPKEPIMKGQSGTIKVTFSSTGKLGVQDRTVTITSNAKQNPMVLHLKGTVDKPVDHPAAPPTK